MANDEVAATLKVLIVDDDEDIRDVLSQLVHRLGHSSTAATDGLEALAALQEERFDVMLLDIAMPRMSGLGVARWLHDNPEVAPDMWTIVLSAGADQSRAPLHELGVHTVVDKPMRLQQLRDLITEGDPARHQLHGQGDIASE